MIETGKMSMDTAIKYLAEQKFCNEDIADILKINTMKVDLTLQNGKSYEVKVRCTVCSATYNKPHYRCIECGNKTEVVR